MATGFERFCMVFGYFVGTVAEGLISWVHRPGSADWWFWTVFSCAVYAVVAYAYHQVRSSNNTNFNIGV